jgi:hypothetical protein
MNNQDIFEIIKKVFTISLRNIDKMQNEKDWEMHLYSLFKQEFGEERIKDYLLFAEFRIAKTDGKTILWISPNKYAKTQSLINEFFNPIFDEDHHVKIELTKNKKPLNNEIIRLLNAEKNRAYYVDLLLLNRKEESRVFLIELKFGPNIKEKVLQDYRKLKRAESARRDQPP